MKRKTLANVLMAAVTMVSLFSVMMFSVSAAYQTVSSTLFNSVTAATLQGLKANNTTVSVDTTKVPAGVSQSIKIVDTASGGAGQFYFVKDLGDTKVASLGNLFGTTDLSQYDGIRLWISCTGTIPGRINVVVGDVDEESQSLPSGANEYQFKAYINGSGADTNNLSIAGATANGYEGYLDLSWSMLTKNADKTTAFNPSTMGIDFIAFKFLNRVANATLYVADLQLYKTVADTTTTEAATTTTEADTTTTEAATTTTEAATTTTEAATATTEAATTTTKAAATTTQAIASGTGTGGNKANPVTGVALPLMAATIGVVSVGVASATKKKSR